MIQFTSILFFLYFFGNIGVVFAQQSTEGIVFDRDTKQRVGKVLLFNKSTNQKIFNNSRGEFKIDLNVGDMLIASKENYFTDTLIYQGDKVLIINMKRASIYIDPVTVVARKTPDQILTERKRDYNKAYRLADPGSLLSVSDNGAGLSIGAIYNYFSKEGKNARRLTQYFEREYQENIIDMRFSRELVRITTGLEGEALDNFLVRYRPSYDFVLRANHYQLISYIKSKYEFFKFVPYIKPLPDLSEFSISPKG
ncbi:hypothetical protein [Sphingobacterium rhinopitheci]|uniref:hypothetical protein n=1 Tax=Sphingobacterium rhinopitheci TaxID=2781960 RepID=UPI001F515E02|nr:hypothetical protein [Sphingobacterium rhinopitheci]MCI0921558.1 hypothetical protein [Sphingobacterium rhinopitheci]